ncbi:MAG: DUF222 domain-containing protein [Acidimicrobiia bacterium]
MTREVEPVDRAVDVLAGLDPDSLDDLTLTTAVAELRRVRARLDAVQARLLDALDRRRPWAEGGYRSTAAWLAASDNTAVGEAHRDVRLARRLRSMPATAAALAAGDITATHARRLAGLAGPGTAAAFAGAEELLVGQARSLRFADFAKACAYWARLARHDAPDPDTADREHRHVSLHDGLRGTGLLTGELTPVAKATVRAALERIETELFDADWAAARAEHGEAATAADLARTPRQRRHDALVEMATRAATAAPGGRRPAPLVSVLVGYQAFNNVCELADGTLVSPGTVASLLDEAVIERVVLDGPSRVLDLGRARSFTGAARRAVEITQPRCDGPGCHIPAHRCHIDHLWRHADGGPTRPDNGRTLCGPHNRDRERPQPRSRSPHPPPPLTPDQQAKVLELLRKRICDRLRHDPTWGDP